MLMKLVLLEILISRKIRTRPENTHLNIYEKSGQVIRPFPAPRRTVETEHHGDLACGYCSDSVYLHPISIAHELGQYGLWYLNGVFVCRLGAPKCGATIGWRPLAQVVRKFT